MNATIKVTLFLLFACLVNAPVAGQVILTGNWTQQDNLFISPPVEDLDAFRDYFRGVLKGYDQYQARADELAAGIVHVGPITLRMDDLGNFGEIGNNVTFNPLATGGTQDIATGGDYIDRQLRSDKNSFEIAQVDIEKNVFRQDFGPVQTNQRVSASGGGSGDPMGDMFEFRFLPAGPAMPFPPAELFANNPTATLSITPEPASIALLAMLLPACCRRRR